jgi:hypothetical protein
VDLARGCTCKVQRVDEFVRIRSRKSSDHRLESARARNRLQAELATLRAASVSEQGSPVLPS